MASSLLLCPHYFQLTFQYHGTNSWRIATIDVAIVGPSEKEGIVASLRRDFNELRHLTPPDYYGSIGFRPSVQGLFWSPHPNLDPALCGPFTSEEALMEGMTRGLWKADSDTYKGDFFRQCFPHIFGKYGPVFMHGDLSLQNIMVQRADQDTGKSLRVTVIDWEGAGWYPPTGSSVMLYTMGYSIRMTGASGLRRC
jgi:hypothetical protein